MSSHQEELVNPAKKEEVTVLLHRFQNLPSPETMSELREVIDVLKPIIEFWDRVFMEELLERFRDIQTYATNEEYTVKDLHYIFMDFLDDFLEFEDETNTFSYREQLKINMTRKKIREQYTKRCKEIADEQYEENPV